MKRFAASGRMALVAALAAAVAHAEAPSDEELRERYAGEYRFSGGSTEEALVSAAVERSVDGMFFIVRGIAYDRLLHVCEVCRAYTLSFASGEVEVRGPCQWPDKGPDDGRAVDHRTKGGDASKLSQRFVDGTLVQDFRGDGGTRHVVWTLLPGEDTLLVHVTITSEHLPHPVDYTLHYRRVALAGQPAAATGPRDAGPPGG